MKKRSSTDVRLSMPVINVYEADIKMAIQGFGINSIDHSYYSSDIQ